MTQPSGQSTEDTTTPSTVEHQPPQQPQQQPQQPQQQTQQTNRGPGPGQQLLDAIEALPERIVNSIKEATPQQRKVVTTPADKPADKPSTVDNKNAAPQGVNLPWDQRFQKWWFGK